MREMRLLLLSEDYGESMLVLTDLENEKLEMILKQIDEDIENGIGRSSEEVANGMFNDCIYKEITDMAFISEVNTEYVASYSCFNFSAVQSKQ